MDMKGIHIGTQAYHLGAIAHGEAGYQTSTTDTTMNLKPHFRERCGDIVGSLYFFKTNLRMAMKMVSPGFQLVLKLPFITHRYPLMTSCF